MRLIGVDLGTTFIKGAVLEQESLSLQHLERLPFPDPIRGLDPAFREFNPEEIVTTTRALLERLLRHAPDAGGIVMCGQMHSLVLTDDAGRAVSNLLNWQDERALMPMPDGGGTYFDEINRLLTAEERRQLGNEPRPGVPLCYLFWLARRNLLPQGPVRADSLPGYVIGTLCGATPTSDVTNASAFGALDVESRAWHLPVIQKLGLGHVQWPEIVRQGAVVGEWRLGDRHLPCYAPVGDYHCAQVGALLAEGELSINISTGSSVIRIADGCEFGDFQTRPWFDDRYLKTVTHIPGGRALNVLVRLLTELAEAQGVRLRDPWDYILAEAGRVVSTDLRVDPAFYYSAMGDHGAITNIRENNLTIGHLFHATAAGMAANYARCAARISPQRDWQGLVFSGGIALKNQLLRRLICDRLGQNHRLAATDEDTLLGLLVLSLAFTGSARSVLESMAIVRGRRSGVFTERGAPNRSAFDLI